MTTAAPPVLKAMRENTVKGENIFLNDVKQVITYMAESVNKVLKMSMRFPPSSAALNVSRALSVNGIFLTEAS